MSLIPFNLRHNNKSKYDIWLQKERERERERTWHSGGEGDCVNWARGSDPSFFLFLGGNYDLFSISLADPSGRRQTCLFLKGCVFVQRVRKWIAKTLTFRLSCHRGICSIGCGEKNRRESQREREREKTTIVVKLFVERRFLALQSYSPLYLLHLFSCNLRLGETGRLWILLRLWFRQTEVCGSAQ